MPEIVMQLAIRDLEPGDLPSCTWSGPATYLAAIVRALDRARLGEVEYLAACPPSGLPVGLGGIDYAKAPALARYGSWQSTLRYSRAASAPSSSRPPSSGSAPAGCAGPS